MKLPQVCFDIPEKYAKLFTSYHNERWDCWIPFKIQFNIRVYQEPDDICLSSPVSFEAQMDYHRKEEAWDYELSNVQVRADRQVERMVVPNQMKADVELSLIHI